VLCLGSSAWSQPTGMLKNYGAAVNVGEYEGTLYCLPHVAAGAFTFACDDCRCDRTALCCRGEEQRVAILQPR
jgi:hypothetical protein